MELSVQYQKPSKYTLPTYQTIELPPQRIFQSPHDEVKLNKFTKYRSFHVVTEGRSHVTMLITYIIKLYQHL